MQEISLTGATLLSDNNNNNNNMNHSHNHSHNHHAVNNAAADDADNNNNNNNNLHPSIELSARIVGPAAAASGHHHNHNHHGGKPCCGPTPTVVQPILSLNIPVTELVQQPTAEILKALWQIIRMGGTFQLFQDIVQAWICQCNLDEDAVYTLLRNAVDNPDTGYSLLHWATKRQDDLAFCEFLCLQVQCPVTRPSTDATQMTPVHWVCTLPSRTALPMLRLFQQQQQQQQGATTSTTTNNNILEVTDATGCTPLLLACQHGHVETAAYLIQVGANVSVVDQHGDSAVHWAAYKGSIHILGLLSFYADETAHFWTAPDAYGQMPLHLAALRGHTTACRYILQHLLLAGSSGGSRRNTQKEVRLVLYHKDTNGRTPLELAKHKEKFTVVATLQAALDQVEKQGWKKVDVRKTATSFFSKHSWKVWLGLPGVGMDDIDESPQFPFYYVWAHIWLNWIFYMTVFYPVFNVGAGVLWDCMGLHIWNWTFGILTAVFLRKTTHTNPGRLDEHHPKIEYWRSLYQRTLERYAHADFSGPQLCHTCHIARPPRSKHDRFSGACIEVFDHMCPFVGGSVGLYNYGFFYLFCLCMTLYFMGFWITLAVYAIRARGVWGTLLYGTFLGVHGSFPLGMVFYHSQLLWLNLSTNEHINTRKYDYFWVVGKDPLGNTTKKFRNPWNRGGWRNVWAKVVEPSDALYALPEEELQQQSLLQHDQLSKP